VQDVTPAFNKAVETSPAEQHSSPDSVSRLAARVAEIEQQISTLSTAALHAMQTPSQRQSRML
jgi:hypothetical protein